MAGGNLKQVQEEPAELFEVPKARTILVPIGALTTAGILAAGLLSFKDGQNHKSQMWMRARVCFQAATVALMVATLYANTRK
ncbi:hypothetical protein O6H91_12G067500 [Diphasiastrum complanatum]|uniref:Uncharacterized protein n=1 Tax=Diphasiastrum complanatum TaxID=34168 RepID=A0ACC2C326_DIPCM|nr:hypothetical protein O6H91_12G067500 [Diphasiastrum complanatum]